MHYEYFTKVLSRNHNDEVFFLSNLFKKKINIFQGQCIIWGRIDYFWLWTREESVWSSPHPTYRPWFLLPFPKFMFLTIFNCHFDIFIWILFCINKLNISMTELHRYCPKTTLKIAFPFKMLACLVYHCRHTTPAKIWNLSLTFIFIICNQLVSKCYRFTIYIYLLIHSLLSTLALLPLKSSACYYNLWLKFLP